MAAGGLCAASQVYRVAHRSLEERLRGRADKREDNGARKVNAWDEARRGRELRRIRRLIRDVGPDEVVVYADEVDIHLDPKIGLDWMLRGQQKEALTPGQNEERYLAGALDARTGRLTWVEGPRKTSPLFLDLLYRLVTRTYRTARRIHCDPRQLRHPRQPPGAPGLGDGEGAAVEVPLPAALLPRSQSHRTCLGGPAANVTRNHRCRTMEQLMAQVKIYLEDPEQVGHHVYPRAQAV